MPAVAVIPVITKFKSVKIKGKINSTKDVKIELVKIRINLSVI